MSVRGAQGGRKKKKSSRIGGRKAETREEKRNAETKEEKKKLDLEGEFKKKSWEEKKNRKRRLEERWWLKSYKTFSLSPSLCSIWIHLETLGQEPKVTLGNLARLQDPATSEQHVQTIQQTLVSLGLCNVTLDHMCQKQNKRLRAQWNLRLAKPLCALYEVKWGGEHGEQQGERLCWKSKVKIGVSGGKDDRSRLSLPLITAAGEALVWLRLSGTDQLNILKPLLLHSG